MTIVISSVNILTHGGKILKKNLLTASLLSAFIALLLLNSTSSVFAVPELTLQVTNLSNNSIKLSWTDLQAMPETTVQADLSCYGNLVASGNWGGVTLELLLKQVGIEPQAQSVEFTAQDGYKVTIPIDRAMQPDVIVAYEKDGAYLSETLRLVVPGANGNVWIAMMTSITLSASQSQIQGQSSGGSLSSLGNLVESLNGIKAEQTSQPAPEQIQSASEPKNETAVQTEKPLETPPITEVQPSQQKATQQPENVGFSAEVGYGITLAAAAVGAVSAALLIYRRRKTSRV